MRKTYLLALLSASLSASFYTQDELAKHATQAQDGARKATFTAMIQSPNALDASAESFPDMGRQTTTEFQTPEDFEEAVKAIIAHPHCTVSDFANLIRNPEKIPGLPRYPTHESTIQAAFDGKIITPLLPFIRVALHIVTQGKDTPGSPYLLQTLGKEILQANELTHIGQRIKFAEKYQEQSLPDLPERTRERTEFLSRPSAQIPEHVIGALASFAFTLSVAHPRIMRASEHVTEIDRTFATVTLSKTQLALNEEATKSEQALEDQEWQQKNRYAAENLFRLVNPDLLANTCAVVRNILSIPSIDPKTQSKIEETVSEIINAGKFIECHRCPDTAAYVNSRSLWQLIDAAKKAKLGITIEGIRTVDELTVEDT